MWKRAANYLVEILRMPEEMAKKVPTIEWKSDKMRKRNEKGYGRSRGGRSMGNYKGRKRKRAREKSIKRDKNKDRPRNPVRLKQN